MVVLTALAGTLTGTGAGAAPASVYLEDFTWTEVRDALAAGTRSVIVPVGGTEQNGSHMTLGKHNVRVRLLAGKVASELGHTLVAPVLAYVPEGSVSPPSGHMRFPGTLSVPDDAFRSVLEGAARSLKQAGFTHILLLGDHGGYQAQMASAAARLNREWAGSPAHALFVADYYRATQVDYVKALRAGGLTEAQIGSHAGAADTSLMLALDPTQVRRDRLASDASLADRDGVSGDPRAASAARGQAGVDLVVQRSVAAIRRSMQGRAMRQARPQRHAEASAPPEPVSRPNLPTFPARSQDFPMRHPQALIAGLGIAVLAAASPWLAAQNRAPDAGAPNPVSPALLPSAPSAPIAVQTVPDMPPVPDATNLYSETGAGRFSAAVAGALPRVYVPNRAANTVSVIDPATLKVVDTFKVGINPQHVVPSWDLRTLWVANNAEGRTDGSLTPIDPSPASRARRSRWTTRTTCTGRPTAATPSSWPKPSSGSTSATRARWSCATASRRRAAPASTTPISRSTGATRCSPASSTAR